MLSPCDYKHMTNINRKTKMIVSRINNLFSQNEDYLVLGSRLMTKQLTTENYPVAKSKTPQKKTAH